MAVQGPRVNSPVDFPQPKSSCAALLPELLQIAARVEKEGLKDIPIGSMYGIYANIGGILMVNVTIYSIH